MQNQDDEPLELDDDFDYDDLDQDFDDSDEFYDDVLDEAFETEEPFAAEQDSFDTDFNDELGETDWEDEQVTETTGKSSGGRKINLSFNTIVISGAVILGLIVLFVQVTKAPPKTATQEKFTSALNMQGATDGPVFGEKKNAVEQEGQNNVEEISQEEGFLFEPEILDSVEIEDGPPQPSAVVSNDSVLTEDMGIEEEPVDIVISTEPQPRAPYAEIVAEIEPVVELEGNVNLGVLETTPDVATPILEEIPNVAEIAIEPENEIVIAEDVAPTPIVVEEVNQAQTVQQQPYDLSVIEDKLDGISERLDGIDERIESVSQANESAVVQIKRDMKAMESKINARSSQPVRTQPKQASVQEPTPKKVQPALKQESKPWELRAAQPGKAWISRQGESKILAVEIGQTIDDLGRINNISFNNGRWIIEGSKVRLMQ